MQEIELSASRSRPHRRLVRTGGFTLIELMITVSILAILTALALPSFDSAILGSRLTSYANNFVSTLQFARTEAIKRGTQVTVCHSSDAAACAASGNWQQGWIAYCLAKTATPTVCDPTGTGTVKLVLQSGAALSSAYSFTATTPSDTYQIDFPATGIGSTEFTLKLCRTSGGDQWREIKVTPTGRTFVTKKTTSTTCS